MFFQKKLKFRKKLKEKRFLEVVFDIILYSGCQYVVYFYLNIEGWKVAAEQELQALELQLLRQVGDKVLLRSLGYLPGTK